MRWLCIFFHHKPKHVGRGVYQCPRCKTVSVGKNLDRPKRRKVEQSSTGMIDASGLNPNG